MNKTYTDKFKTRVVRQARAGMKDGIKLSELAQLLDVTCETIEDWLKKDDEGTLLTNRKTEKPVNQKVLALLLEELIKKQARANELALQEVVRVDAMYQMIEKWLGDIVGLLNPAPAAKKKKTTKKPDDLHIPPELAEMMGDEIFGAR